MLLLTMKRRSAVTFLLIGLLILETSLPVKSFFPSGVRASIGTMVANLLHGPSRSHHAITEQACLQVAQEALLAEGLLSSRVPPSELEASSLVQRAFGDEASAKDFQRAMNEIGEANSDVDDIEESETEAHFDAEDFIEGNRRLLNLRRIVITQILNKEFERARVAAGRFLHTLQDFYSHSNWIELGHRTPNAALGNPGSKLTNIAPLNSPTCINCQDTTCRNNLIANVWFLTSGYYHGQRIKKPDAETLTRTATNQGKCSHGGFIDKSRHSTASGGINKDSTLATFSPHWYLHPEAAEVAIAASVNFFEDIREQVGSRLFLRFKGLDYGASLSFCIDTTSSMMNDIAEVIVAVKQIVDFKLAGGVLPSEYVLVEFNDPEVGPVFLTSNPDQFKAAIAAIRVVGGGDTPEMAIGGLILALQRSRPGSTIYVFTDAPAKDYRRYPEALTLIYDKGIEVFFVLTRGFRKRRDTVDEFTVFDLIADASGGQVLSGTRSDVSELLTITSSFTAASGVTLTSIDSLSPAFPPGGHNWTVPIDSSLSNMTFSLSGRSSSIFLFDQDGRRIAVAPFNIVELAESVVLRLPSPSVGDLTVQVITVSSYTLRVKGLSTLDFLHSFVIPVERTHSDLFPVRGLPRTGDSVFVLLTLVGLTSNHTVDQVFFQSENGTVLSRYGLVKPNATNNEFITKTAVVIPSLSFHVGIFGSETPVGASFQRIDANVVNPAKFQVDIKPHSSLVLKQGRNSSIRFSVLNGPDAPSDSFTFSIDDDLKFAGTPSPTRFSLGPGENQTVAVLFFVPSCYPSSSIDTVTTTVTSDTTAEFNSFVLRIVVDSEFEDSAPPVCALRSVDRSSCSGSCFTSWRAEFDVLDRSSAIFQISSVLDRVGTIISYDKTAAKSSNTWITVLAENISCCEGTILTVTDLSGNKGNCSVSPMSSVPVCTLGCLNGGRCVATNKCECLGTFHGDRCENGGCPRPPVPENGQISMSSGSRNYSYEDVVEWVCKDGYEMVGNNATTCCQYGWTGAVPQCVASAPISACVAGCRDLFQEEHAAIRELKNKFAEYKRHMAEFSKRVRDAHLVQMAALRHSLTRTKDCLYYGCSCESVIDPCGNPCQDADGDGVDSTCDNCPTIANDYQQDFDGDMVGDVCDNCPNKANSDQADSDMDGMGDKCDNCKLLSNINQTDSDGDQVGDVCDNCQGLSDVNQTDTDSDMVGDKCDNCPNISNNNQEDSDDDEVGNACDNCPNKPNSAQKDSDNDGVGDACDNCPNNANSDQADSDMDGVGDKCDNCKLMSNINQADSDGDHVGDVCDECEDSSSINETDTDNDMVGDRCDNCRKVRNNDQEDSDGDKVGNACDNCPNKPNVYQKDSDDDTVGDACDNCPNKTNKNQEDKDEDLVGDVCDTGKDRDADARQDDRDNCPDVPNSGQADADDDGVGDGCNGDKDGDGLNDNGDNCPVVANGNQTDSNNDGVGDLCEGDNDGDGVVDDEDACPLNKRISTPELTQVETVHLRLPHYKKPNWVVYDDKGTKIRNTVNGDGSIALGYEYFGSVDFEGKVHVNAGSTDDDFIGFVFAYQNNRHFYVVSWHRHVYKWIQGRAGVAIKKVRSQSGPSRKLQNALWKPTTTAGEVYVLWHDSQERPWTPGKWHTWKLKHRQAKGLINLQFCCDAKNQTIESGDIYDSEYKGGRLGVYTLSQGENVTFSDVRYNCPLDLDYALQFNGNNGYVFLQRGIIVQLTSFSVTVWVKVAPGQQGVIPVFCTPQSEVCLYIENGHLKCKLQGKVVVGGAVSTEKWVHVALAYDYNSTTSTVSLFVDGSLSKTDSVGTFTGASRDVDIGRSGNKTQYIYFKGEMDELSLWNKTLNESEVRDRALLDDLSTVSGDLLAHYTMDTRPVDVLYDQTGHFNGQLLGGVRKVESSLVKKF